MKSQKFRAAALLIAALSLGGCAAALQGFPDRVKDSDAELAILGPFMTKEVITKYQNESDADKKKLIRDEYVNAQISAINIHFGEFEKALFREGVGAGIGTDWIKLALGGVGALYSSVSQAFSAATAFIEGAKASFDKQAFFENTITTLFAAMDANRKTVQVKIREGLDQPVADYPLTQAMADLEDYYIAGTIPGALISINADSGAKGKEAVIALRGITAETVSKEMFLRRLELMNTIDGLDKDKAIALLPKIETEFPEIKPFMARYDAVRAADAATGSKAKKLLKQSVPLTAKSRDDADKWQAAIDSL